MRRFILAAVAPIVFAACQPATNELSEAQLGEIQHAVIQAYEGYWNEWAAFENLDDYMAYYCVWAGSPLAGWESMDAVRAGAEEYWANYNSWDVAFQETRVLVLGLDVAAVEGTTESVVTDTSGTAEVWTQKSTSVWILRDGRWKILTFGFHFNQRRPV